MTHSKLWTLRIWLLPLLVLLAASGCLLTATLWVDSHGQAVHHGSRVLFRMFHPNPNAAATTLANAGEIVAAVLAIALTVVSIVVELASNRYTHRVTELFVSEPVNFVVMSVFVVTAVQSLWVTMTIDPRAANGFIPYFSVDVTMVMLTICLLILLPYFAYVFAFLNPVQIVDRICGHTLQVIARPSRFRGLAYRKREAIRGVEQLADVAVNAMQHRDKGVSMASVHALKQLLLDYQGVRGQLPEAWFKLEEELVENPDFVSMDEQVLAEVAARRSWFEMKILRQYQTIYGEALHRLRDISYVVAIDTRSIAEQAQRSGDIELLHLCMKFFNTYIRAAINARDVRTAYNVFNQYRLLAQALLEVDDGAYAVEIARYFKYYGLISYAANLPFILETVAYDLCALTELAYDRHSPVVNDVLRILLRVDKESEGAVQEQSLRGVRKAQVKLATFFMLRGEETLARQVYHDMAHEDRALLASIRDELISVRASEYWEIIDRGSNFDFLPLERRPHLDEFFAWFDGLPRVRSMLSSAAPAAPGQGATGPDPKHDPI
ncbi:MAG: DUF2254 family protein [Polyangiales bacterium]